MMSLVHMNFISSQIRPNSQAWPFTLTIPALGRLGQKVLSQGLPVFYSRIVLKQQKFPKLKLTVHVETHLWNHMGIAGVHPGREDRLDSISPSPWSVSCGSAVTTQRPVGRAASCCYPGMDQELCRVYVQQSVPPLLTPPLPRVYGSGSQSCTPACMVRQGFQGILNLPWFSLF